MQRVTEVIDCWYDSGRHAIRAMGLQRRQLFLSPKGEERLGEGENPERFQRQPPPLTSSPGTGEGNSDSAARFHEPIPR